MHSCQLCNTSNGLMPCNDEFVSPFCLNVSCMSKILDLKLLRFHLLTDNSTSVLLWYENVKISLTHNSTIVRIALMWPL